LLCFQINAQLYEDHQYLKTASDTLKDYETKLQQATDKLSTERVTNAQLEQDVRTFELRQRHLSDLKFFKMKRPWLVRVAFVFLSWNLPSYEN
jgi:hypothetical protein